MELTRRSFTNVVRPTGKSAPMGYFVNVPKYPLASDKRVTAPNADTLYSTAWIDVGKEPYILHVPDEQGRYYLMPMLDGWTDVFADPGKRTTGTGAADFAITGPGWKGTLPPGVKAEYKSPTNIVWVLGRTYSTGTPEDYADVNAIQAQYKLDPAQRMGQTLHPAARRREPGLGHEGRRCATRSTRMDGATYFRLLADADENEPAGGGGRTDGRYDGQDRAGPRPGFRPSKIDPARNLPRFTAAPRAAQAAIMGLLKRSGSDQRLERLYQDRRLRHRLSASALW